MTTGNVGTNGETVFHNVMMAMYPDAEGTMLDAISAGMPVQITANIDVNETNIEEIDDLNAVVFLQDDDKNVLQSEMVSVQSPGVGLSEGQIETVRLYPNPASDCLFIEGKGVKNVWLYNSLGQLVVTVGATDGTCKVDVSALATGLYLLNVVANTGESIAKRIVVE